MLRVLVWTLAWGWLWRKAHPLAGPSMVGPARAPARMSFPSLIALPTPLQVDRLFPFLRAEGRNLQPGSYLQAFCCRSVHHPCCLRFDSLESLDQHIQAPLEVPPEDVIAGKGDGGKLLLAASVYPVTAAQSLLQVLEHDGRSSVSYSLAAWSQTSLHGVQGELEKLAGAASRNSFELAAQSNCTTPGAAKKLQLTIFTAFIFIRGVA